MTEKWDMPPAGVRLHERLDTIRERTMRSVRRAERRAVVVRTATGVLIGMAAITAVVTALVALEPAYRPDPAASQPAAPATSVPAPPTTSPPLDGTPTDGAGFAGAYGWRFTAEGLVVSGDGGAGWVPKPLPSALVSAVTANAFDDGTAAVSVDEEGRLVVASTAGDVLTVASAAGISAPWTSSTMDGWDSGLASLIAVAPQRMRVSIGQGPGGTVGIVTEYPLGNASAEVTVQVSEDGGAHFTRRSAGNRLNSWTGLVFTDARHGVAIDGPSSGFVVITSDGGADWTELSPSGALTGASLSGPVVVHGVPLVLAAVARGDTVRGQLLEVDAAMLRPVGAAFELATASSAADFSVTTDGAAVLVADGDGDARVSSDGGARWSPLRLLAHGSRLLGMQDPQRFTVRFTPGSSPALLAWTDDAGASWHVVGGADGTVVVTARG